MLHQSECRATSQLTVHGTWTKIGCEDVLKRKTVVDGFACIISNCNSLGDGLTI